MLKRLLRYFTPWAPPRQTVLASPSRERHPAAMGAARCASGDMKLSDTLCDSILYAMFRQAGGENRWSEVHGFREMHSHLRISIPHRLL
jgi:hypothetical protein